MNMNACALRRLILPIAACIGAFAPGLLCRAAPPAPPPAPAPAPAPVAPERTSSVFGDWTMSCIQHAAAGAPAAKQCEASLSIQDQQHQIGMVFAIGHAAKGQPLMALLQVPANIRTNEPAVLEIDNEPIKIAFYQCNPRGCFAQLDLKDDSVLRRIRAHDVETPGHLKWHDSSNTEIVAPFSTRGFAAAMDALTAADNGKP